jgi:hypothetical protein
MPKKTDAALLEIGNETVKSLKTDPLTRDTMPKGSWEVSYTVENSTLTFSILLSYDIFHREFMSSLADPTLWITVVALFAATALKKHISALPKNLRVVFIVTGGITDEWKSSCTIADLASAGRNAEGKKLDDACTIMMTTMVHH